MHYIERFRQTQLNYCVWMESVKNHLSGSLAYFPKVLDFRMEPCAPRIETYKLHANLELCWFSLKCRPGVSRWRVFRPWGGDFQGIDTTTGLTLSVVVSPAEPAAQSDSQSCRPLRIVST